MNRGQHVARHVSNDKDRAYVVRLLQKYGFNKLGRVYTKEKIVEKIVFLLKFMDLAEKRVGPQ